MNAKKRKVLGIEARETFFNEIAAGKLSLIDAIKNMRKILGMTQVEYAKFVGVAPRIIIDIERGVGNPTLETLRKIGRPYGLDVGYKARN